MLKKSIFCVFFLAIFFTVPLFLKYVYAGCSDQKPGSAPILLLATSSEDSVTLAWQEAADPVSYYLLAYGTSENSFEFGLPNIGGKGTTAYTINNLSKGIKYYFKVRAGNGCKPGRFSNKLSAIPGKEIKNEPRNIVLPTLSILRTGLEASISPILRENRFSEGTLLSVGRATESVKGICEHCNAGIFLVGEIIFLFSYFLISYRSKNLIFKPIYSIALPLIIYLMYLNTNGKGGCLGERFLCKYFIFINLFIYILLTVIYRQVIIARHDSN